MKCKRCGKETPDNIPNCIHCGFIFEKSKNTSQTNKSTPKIKTDPFQIQRKMQEERKEKQKKQNIILISIIAAIVLLILVIVIGITIKHNSNENIAESYSTVSDYSTDFNESVYDEVTNGFSNIEKKYLVDGYVKPESINALLEDEYEYANSLIENGIAVDATIEKENICVSCRLKQGDLIIYMPKLDGLKAGKGSNRIVTVQPYYSSKLKSDKQDKAAKNIASSIKQYSFTESDNLNDADVTLDNLKKLSGSKIIIWDGHGGYSFTNQSSFISISVKYKDVRKSKKYGKLCDGCKILSSSDGEVLLTADFFKEYYDDGAFDDAIIYLGACLTGFDSKLADTFIQDLGASAVYANYYLTPKEYDANMTESIFASLTKGKTTGEALKIAQDKYGRYCPEDEYKGDYLCRSNELLCFGDENYTLKKQLGNITSESKRTNEIDYSEIEKYLTDYAFNGLGAYMPFRGNNNSIYFADSINYPSSVFSFDKNSYTCKKIIRFENDTLDTETPYVLLGEQGVMYKTMDRDTWQINQNSVYDYSGKEITADGYTAQQEYDGKYHYLCSPDENMVESVDKDAGVVGNTNIHFNLEETEYNDWYIEKIYTCKGNLFVLLENENTWRLIAADDKCTTVADLDKNTCLYIDGDILYYQNGGILYKTVLTDNNYKASVVCKLNADNVYFVLGDRVYYSRWINDCSAKICYLTISEGKEYELAEGVFPMDSI